MSNWKEYEGTIKELNAKMFGDIPYGIKKVNIEVFDEDVIKIGDVFDIYDRMAGQVNICTIVMVSPDCISVDFWRFGEKQSKVYGPDDVTILLKHTPMHYVPTPHNPVGCDHAILSFGYNENNKE